ncbi:MAG: hypothetical protein VB056_07240 [Sphaerochaeta associata]|uniref:hypothetical protein n=1 Tax=Sphaerochaeta associata TaxID=1129264 RepID=UPI002B2167CD|nr:hypothetical protein [Sphaerochaeta associata]MEA5028658.1 hypothetical protein [Sphaerochaeta associata]
MKRKFLVTLLVVCVLLPAALSAAIVDLSLGATAQYNQNLGQIKTDMDNEDFWPGLGDFKNYTIGADVRIKLLIAEVDVVGTFANTTRDGVDYTEISALTTAGISLDLLGFARLGFGLGPRFRVLIDDAGKAQVIASDNTTVDTWENFGDAFIKSPVAYRATVDFNLGSLMLGLNYTLDTLYTFENAQEVNKLFEAKMDDGKFGVSLLFSLF